jgi:60Kd inner membrane protein
MGLRRVEARSGRPPGLAAAIVLDSVPRIVKLIVASAVEPRAKLSIERVRELQPQLRAIQRQHADDRAAQQQALMSFYKAHQVNPAGSFAWNLMPLLASTFVRRLLARWRRLVWVTEDWPAPTQTTVRQARPTSGQPRRRPGRTP